MNRIAVSRSTSTYDEHIFELVCGCVVRIAAADVYRLAVTGDENALSKAFKAALDGHICAPALLEARQ